MTVKANGSLEWNTALQLTMGDPTWIDIMWDSEDRLLGIRAVNSPTGFPVEKEPKSGEYTVPSRPVLSAYDITIPEKVSGPPEVWTQDQGAGYGPLWFGHNIIYYLTVPEP